MPFLLISHKDYCIAALGHNYQKPSSSGRHVVAASLRSSHFSWYCNKENADTNNTSNNKNPPKRRNKPYTVSSVKPRDRNKSSNSRNMCKRAKATETTAAVWEAALRWWEEQVVHTGPRGGRSQNCKKMLPGEGPTFSQNCWSKTKMEQEEIWRDRKRRAFLRSPI